MLKIYTFIIGICLFPFCIYAQTTTVSLKVHEVMDMFGTLQQGVWINHYAGIGTEGDSFVFTLGHNAKEYKGILQNISRGELYVTEGKYQPEEVKLVVQDTTYDLLGFLYGEVNPGGMMVQLLDKRKEKGRYIEFEKVNRDGFKILDCPSQVWYKSFNGIMDRDPVFIQIQKEKDQRVYGTISVAGKLTGYTISGNCDDNRCQKMKLKVYDYFGERFKEYKSSLISARKIQVEEFFKDRFQIFEDWNLENTYHFQCKNIRLPAIKMYAQYIKINDRFFDPWIESFITKWTEQVISFYQPGAIQEQRDAIANMDIDWISQDWVSGIFKFTEPWSDAERSLPFTFDRRLGRIISLDESFDKDFNHQVFFAEFISRKKKEMIEANNSNRFRAYLDLEYFNLWTLRPEGLCFTSEFNSVWGMRKIIIPYSLIQEHIRRGGPFKKLF